MALIGLVGLAIIGGAAWQSEMDTKRWVIAVIGAVIAVVLMCAGSDIAFSKSKED